MWNMWLIFATFWLAILGRSSPAAESSVRCMLSDSLRSAAGFKWFLLVTLVAFAFFFFKNKSHLRSEHKLESLISRESSFLFNNLLLLAGLLYLLWGTWFPLISAYVQVTRSRWVPPSITS